MVFVVVVVVVVVFGSSRLRNEIKSWTPLEILSGFSLICSFQFPFLVTL